jgi:hypothetical protein
MPLSFLLQAQVLCAIIWNTWGYSTVPTQYLYVRYRTPAVSYYYYYYAGGWNRRKGLGWREEEAYISNINTRIYIAVGFSVSCYYALYYV